MTTDFFSPRGGMWSTLTDGRLTTLCAWTCETWTPLERSYWWNSISYWESQCKRMPSGREAWSRSYHSHLLLPNLWRRFFGVLNVNVGIIILNNPQQGGDGGCMWQPELHLSPRMGDVFHPRAGTQECFCMFQQPCINVKNVAEAKRGVTLIN